MNIENTTNDIKIEKERLHQQNEKKIKSIDELELGDHLIIVFNDVDYFHSILISIEKLNDDCNFFIEVIFYNNEKLSSSVQELIKQNFDVENDEDKKFIVQKRKFIYDQTRFELYKVVYDENCLTSVETIEKASKLIGELKYNAFENNDEHFAIYCKTGKAGKLFLIDTAEIDTKEVFGSTIYDKIKGTLRKTGTNIVLFNVAQRIASRFPRSLLASSLPTILKKGTPLLGIGMEGLSITNDIHAKYKEAKEGKLTDIKFKKYILKRVARSTMGFAGGIGGGIVGQMFIPVPVFGAMVGGFFGGLVGSAVGYAQGALIGEVVETVDHKLHQLLGNLAIENVNVLENLALNIDDVNDCEYVIVNEEDCVEKFDNLTETMNYVNNEKSINHEDYDIYLLDNLTDKNNIQFDSENNHVNETVSVNFVIKKPKID